MKQSLRMGMLAAGTALALTACAQPAPPKDRFYRLNPAPVAARSDVASLAVIEIGRLGTDGVLSERPLAYQDENGALGRYRYDLWAEPPAALMQNALVQALRQSNLATTVVTPDLRVPPDWILHGRLIRFEMIPGAGKVVVSLELAVVSARDGRILLLGNYAEDEICAPDPEAEAQALSRATSAILASFISDLHKAAQP